jgi:undecaprenyl-diphosphatase
MTLSGTLGYIQGQDLRLMRRMNRWRPPRWVRLWMILATHGGDGWLWLSVGAGVYLFGGRRRIAALGAGALAVLAGIAIFLVVKRMTGRARPCTLERHSWARLLPPDQFSFPSGHTITAFAVLVPVGFLYPALLPILLFLALSISVSRIVLGMHFLSDVVAGCLIGSLLGYTSLHLVLAMAA